MLVSNKYIPVFFSRDRDYGGFKDRDGGFRSDRDSGFSRNREQDDRLGWRDGDRPNRDNDRDRGKFVFNTKICTLVYLNMVIINDPKIFHIIMI